MQFYSIGIEVKNARTWCLFLDKSKDEIFKGLEITEKKVGDLIFLSFGIQGVTYGSMNKEKEELRSYITGVVSKMILEDVQQQLIERMIEDEYFYFTKEEKNRIIQDAALIMWGGSPTVRSEVIRNGWYNRIWKRIYEHFDSNNELIVEGFVRFRLKDLVKELSEALSQAVDDLIIEKEYNEFIKLLRYFVEVQEPKVEEVHVMMDEDKKYTLLDSSLRIINNDILEDLAKEISDKEISYDDLLISSLITIAPNRITIHEYDKIKNTELLNTIKNVFYGRVVMSHEGVIPK